MNETLLDAMPPEMRARAAKTIFEARRFDPVDRRRFEIEPEAFRLNVAVRQVGNLRVSAAETARGMRMSIADPGAENYTLGLRRSGSVSLASGWSNAESWGANKGVLYRERAGVSVAIGDGHAGLAIEIPPARLTEVLAAMIERPVTRAVEFDPAVPLDRPGGAALARVVAFLEQELAASDGLLSRPSVAPAAEELLIRTLLTAQPHTYSHLLEREAKSAAPSQVRRALAFMRDHATEALTLDRIAAAAGCGVRALQLTFQRTVGRSPMEELRRIRLDLARLELQATESPMRIIDLAEKYRFSSGGRFSAYYRARYGVLPSGDARNGEAPPARDRRDRG